MELLEGLGLAEDEGNLHFMAAGEAWGEVAPKISLSTPARGSCCRAASAIAPGAHRRRAAPLSRPRA